MEQQAAALEDTQREGVSWDTWMPIGMQVAVMVLAVQACEALAYARAADDASLFPMAAEAPTRDWRTQQRAATQAQAAAAQQAAWHQRVAPTRMRVATGPYRRTRMHWAAASPGFHQRRPIIAHVEWRSTARTSWKGA